MADGIERLGAIVVKRYGTGTENGELAEVVSSCDAPSFHLRAADGAEYHWRQDLTRPATSQEEVKYWQLRAENAERLIDKFTTCLSKTQEQNAVLIERL